MENINKTVLEYVQKRLYGYLPDLVSPYVQKKWEEGFNWIEPIEPIEPDDREYMLFGLLTEDYYKNNNIKKEVDLDEECFDDYYWGAYQNQKGSHEGSQEILDIWYKAAAQALTAVLPYKHKSEAVNGYVFDTDFDKLIKNALSLTEEDLANTPFGWAYKNNFPAELRKYNNSLVEAFASCIRRMCEEVPDKHHNCTLTIDCFE